VNAPSAGVSRETSYGESPLTFVDRFGVALSRRAVLRAIGARDDLDVLDLGCGFHARMLRALGSRLRSGLGVDVRISDAARRVDRLAFQECTIEDALFALPDQTFDVVLILSVLEHLADPLDVLEHARRVARPGGVVLINVPTWRGKAFLELSAFRLGLSPVVEMNDHKMYYDIRDLWPLLVRAGFRPIDLSLRYHKFGLNLFAVARG
jgi:SAM-dependent methyltransferase